MEVWNGAWTLDDEASLLAWDNLLAGGSSPWLPAVGNSDAHAFEDAVGSRRPLSRPLSAAAHDTVVVELAVTGVADPLVLLVTDQGEVLRTMPTPDADNRVRTSWRTSPTRSRYVRTEVRHAGVGLDHSADVAANELAPMAAMTNPIWLGSPS